MCYHFDIITAITGKSSKNQAKLGFFAKTIAIFTQMLYTVFKRRSQAKNDRSPKPQPMKKRRALMQYEIKKNKLYTRYSHVYWADGEAYWVSDAKHVTSTAPIGRLHYHNMHEMGVCVSGSGSYQINERLYHFKKGDIVFVNHFTPHGSNSDVGYSAKWKLLFFDPVRLLQLAGMLDPDKVLLTAGGDIPFSGVFAPDEYPELTDFIKTVIEKSEIQDEYTDISIAFSIGNFIVDCARYTKSHAISTKPTMMDKRQYHKIAPAISQINKYMSSSAMIEEPVLAELCKMSISNLRRLFKRYTGLSPKAYIKSTRMSYAEYLIVNTNMTVLKISTEVGYSEVSGFNRTFRQTFGTSPTEYRKNNQ